MQISTAELVGKVKNLMQASDALSNQLNWAQQELSRHASSLAALTRGSRSGEQATHSVLAGADAMSKAVLSLRELNRSGQDFIQNAIK
ncbi:MAG: hypothetical protein LKI34_06035 [Bifidobacterium tibiigranuli]|uniref:hypothetical protein n=1 Tax=Bifidobacterium tibiigranuli TaxID=2172043 RepID=UPI0026ED9760|nr:hypothetical protein [Bifidobacterium tibiigranuli]MCI1673754.1 hypothetical protein [Bifidobacterium tibiigranuli]MCI1712003.1 hypothetical protein [Bifidobacterium tibiigranuli]